MEQNLNEQQKAILALLEKKKFEELSDKEKALVVKHMSEEEYLLQYTLLQSSGSLYDEVEPKPLVLNNKKKGAVIPLYQAIAGIAAALLISFFVFRSEKTIVVPGEKIIVAQTDTVYVDKVIVDTIIEYKTKMLNNRLADITSGVNGVGESSMPIVIDDNLSLLPELTTLNLENGGSSAVEDQSIAIIRDLELW